MRIAKAAEITGLSKKSIQVYIERGLLSPSRDSNKYYNFSESDIERLNHIKTLRMLGLGLTQIKLLYEDPEAAMLILADQKYRIHRQMEIGEAQLVALDRLMKSNLKKPSRSLGAYLNSLHLSLPPQRPNRPIDPLDADMLLSSFWVLYSSSLELSDFQLYLWSKLKQMYMESDSEYLRHYRSRLVSLCGDNDMLQEQIRSAAFYRNIYSGVSRLKQEDIFAFVSQKCAEVEKNLSNAVWVELWMQDYQSGIQGIYAAYADPFVDIMIQFSRAFADFQRNIEKITQSFRAFYTSGSGSVLRDLVQSKLKDTFDLKNTNDIIRLLFFTPEMPWGGQIPTHQEEAFLLSVQD